MEGEQKFMEIHYHWVNGKFCTMFKQYDLNAIENQNHQRNLFITFYNYYIYIENLHV